MQKYNKRRAKTAQKLVESPFAVELTIGADVSFCDVLLESIDEAFSSLGESAKASIYSYLENEMDIRELEIPFRIDDFQNALERIFGMGARHLEILFIMHLHEKLKTKYKWHMPRWVVPELTFKEYVRLLKTKLENSNARTKENDLEYVALE